MSDFANVPVEGQYDLAVIGGGINGCGIARDAAGRGLSVLLLEQDDLASATSSASSKLIHGGIRYLEHYEFRLVRESLRERDVVLNIAPHIARPLRFVFPHNPGMRPMWMIRAGLFLYDHLGGREFPRSRRIGDFRNSEVGRLLKPRYTRAFEYSDCWIDDSRLVVLTARDASERGADVLTRTRCDRASGADGRWVIDASNVDTGEARRFHARVLVNATGPWVSSFLSGQVDAERIDPQRSGTRKVKGSHLVVRRWFEHDRAYILQNSDERIVFVLPYEDDYALVGTTDVDFDGDPSAVTMSEEERDYLLRCVGDYFEHELTAGDVISHYAGVRPLYDDGVSKAQEATRDYVLTYERTRDAGGLLCVFGGKLTTYRKLAEAALARIGDDLGPLGASWTGGAPLPGGDFAPAERDAVRARLASRYPFVPEPLLHRWFRSYGTELSRMLGEAASMGDLGRHFGAMLYEAEVRYLVDHEWARRAEDILWRRGKLGLVAAEVDVAALEQWLAGYTGSGLSTDSDTGEAVAHDR